MKPCGRGRFKRLDDDSSSVFLGVARAVWLGGAVRECRQSAAATGFQVLDDFARSG